MHVASILALSYPAIPLLGQLSDGNVCLQLHRGKLQYLFYNPLQAIEFRINHVIRRLVRGLPEPQKPLQFSQRIRPHQHRPKRSRRA